MLTAALLYLGDFAVELLAPDIQKMIDGHPQFKKLVWLLLFFCLAAAVYFFMQEHNSLAQTDAEPAENAPPTEDDKINRRAMMNRVRQAWVEGVLHQSLWNHARIILNLEGKSDAVVHPCDLHLRRAGHKDETIPSGTPIFEIYEQAQGELLLLGDPGSGKTTLMLEIAERLIADAENDPTQPIPVVFNLSAWREQHTRLDGWLVEQLNQDYGIHPKLGKRWVANGALLLLLDGLDEVAESRRAACVDAINTYRTEHELVMRPMVVCCRTQEYDAIPNLRLNHAVVLQPLTIAQVDDYLRGGGKPLAGLRAVLRDEPALYHELFATPLMLHVAVVTYKNETAAALRAKVSPEERMRRLWDAYIERMFERKIEDNPKYSKTQAVAWLEWLGKYLTRKDLQKYLIEGMQPDDLPRPYQTFFVRLPNIFLLNIYRNIDLQPIRRFNSRRMRHEWKHIVFGAMEGATTGALIGFIGIVTGFTLKGSAFFMVLKSEAVFMILCFVTLVIMCTVGIAVNAAIPVLFDENVTEKTVYPNQSIYYAFRVAGAFVLLGAVGGAATGAIAGAIMFAGREATIAAGVASMLGAVWGAMYGVLMYGGKTVFQHYLLRFFLWRSGKFPRNITAFLDWSAQRVLVQRVGGGWRFIHRTMQERFAERYDARYADASPPASPVVMEAQSVPEQNSTVSS